MRLIISLVLFFITVLVQAGEFTISTTSSKDGNTIFFLQKGPFNSEKESKDYQKQLSSYTNEPIEIKKTPDKELYTLQIGPIKSYNDARELKKKLSQKEYSTSVNQDNQSPPPLEIPASEKVAKPIQETVSNKKLWNLRNADIRAVIGEVSRLTGKNFVIDPRVQGKISIVSSTPMNNDQLYQVFLSMLQVSGFAAIPSDKIIKIIPNIDAKTLSPDQISEFRNSPKGDDMMVEVVPVHYVPADQLVPVLRPLMPQWSSIAAYAPSNMLILSGRANNIRSLAKIIKQVDNSSVNNIDMIHLKHSLAMDIANTLKELVKVQPTMGGIRQQITIAADDRSNSLLISGSKTDRIRIRMLILKLDKKSSEGLNTNTQVVYLHYLRAEDLVPILAGVAQANFSGNVGTTIGTITRPELDSTNPAASVVDSNKPIFPTNSPSSSSASSSAPLASSAATANTTSSSTQNEGSTKPSVQIIAEPNTNSIILNAPASIVNILKKVIHQLDIRPAQLLIEALIAEINQDDINGLGIEWGSMQQTGKPESFRPGFAIINNKTTINDLQAQIYALAREKKANILSTPSVVVLDNRQAKILVGKQVSVASSNYPNNAGGTTPASPYTTFDRVNVALHLYVRPQITQGQGIQLQIDQGNDTLDPAIEASISTNPTFRVSSIVTSVHVESGDIVVLGGLTQNSLGSDNNRIPILGDIPGVGRLFQHNINIRERRVLMVFIKPIILHNEHENMFLASEKYNNIRQEELAWLKSQNAFVQSNNASVMPPLKKAELPKPFNRPLLLATK